MRLLFTLSFTCQLVSLPPPPPSPSPPPPPAVYFRTLKALHGLCITDFPVPTACAFQ